MPKSRGRKKKKKKTKIVYGKTSGVKRELVNGIELKLDGKNITVKNKRTKKQHEEYIQQVIANRPKNLEFIEKSIERVIEIFKTFDNFQLLGFLSYNHFLNHNNSDDDGMAEVTLEYANSFATALSNNPTKQPTTDIFEELKDLLTNIRMAYNAYISTEGLVGNYTEQESHLRFLTVLEALHMRGDGYMNHIYEVFKEMFSGHDQFFIDNYGFNSNDILETFIQLEDSWYCRLRLPNGAPHPSSMKRFKEWYEAKGIKSFRADDPQPMIDFLADNPDFVSREGKPDGFLINDPKQFQELHKIRFRKEQHKKVAEAITQDFGENTDFLNPKFQGLPLNETLISQKPIIKYKNELYLFAFNILTRNIFDIAESLIKNANKKYYKEKYLGNKYSLSRDNYLENKTAELLDNFIKKSTSYLNLKYKPGILDENDNLVETELDLLIVSEKANYIIEIKAGGLSAPSKRGALKSLTGQLSETVGYGAYQSHRAYKYILEDDNNSFYDKQGNLINVDNTKKTFRLTITLEHLSGFISNLHELKELGIVKPDVEFAWNCSLFDLMIFSDILENEDDFIEYLEQRIPLFTSEKIRVNDEIDLLGYFLENGKLVDEKLLKKVDDYSLNKTSQEIDEYFQKGGKKPRKKR
ncbi:hypothetical protein Celal_0211 [Cellulophaga algicola DSM 14237]|uniref:NERD domain-containing protein n=1 Tax=Cellulophaga algicola (strain DSM 14237 / IC166 / ACAM 630) TaxID=688270 RepID=E6X7W8_CELAD|nr:hypothetical protein [Cellulophaga algicola]ADV47561.1 hypothetical protein Celal_0211 [Cellulophaga algicola DSM 14237]